MITGFVLWRLSRSGVKGKLQTSEQTPIWLYAQLTELTICWQDNPNFLHTEGHRPQLAHVLLVETCDICGIICAFYLAPIKMVMRSLMGLNSTTIRIPIHGWHAHALHLQFRPWGERGVSQHRDFASCTRGVFLPPFVRKLATSSTRNPSLRGGRFVFRKIIFPQKAAKRPT